MVAHVKDTWVCKRSLAGLGAEIQSLQRGKSERKEEKKRTEGRRRWRAERRKKLHIKFSHPRAGWEHVPKPVSAVVDGLAALGR